MATATATTIGQSEPSALDRVAMNHGADVDAEHALGGDTDPAGHPVRAPAQPSASTMPTTSAANSAADGTPSMVSGTVTATVTASSNAQLSIRRTVTIMTSMPLSLSERKLGVMHVTAR